VTSFTQPNRGESAEDYHTRREAMIAFVSRKHCWPFERTVEFLESLNHIGIAYIGVDMREETRIARRLADDFANTFPFS